MVYWKEKHGFCKFKYLCSIEWPRKKELSLSCETLSVELWSSQRKEKRLWSTERRNAFCWSVIYWKKKRISVELLGYWKKKRVPVVEPSSTQKQKQILLSHDLLKPRRNTFCWAVIYWKKKRVKFCWAVIYWKKKHVLSVIYWKRKHILLSCDLPSERKKRVLLSCDLLSEKRNTFCWAVICSVEEETRSVELWSAAFCKPD